MNKIIVQFCSLHPKKLDNKYWEIRELEYLYTLNENSDFNFIIIDNTIDNINEISNEHILNLITKKDFPVMYHDNILDKNLYSYSNDFGFLNMVKKIINMYSSKSIIFVNGRIYNYKNTLKLLYNSNYGSDVFFHSKKINDIFSDIFLIDNKNLDNFIDNFNDFSINDNFNSFLKEYIANSNTVIKNLSENICKNYHFSKDDYAKLKIQQF